MSTPSLDQLPFTIDNLPYGVIKTSTEPSPRCAVAIGQYALDLTKYAKTNALSSLESGHNFKFESLFADVSVTGYET